MDKFLIKVGKSASKPVTNPTTNTSTSITNTTTSITNIATPTTTSSTITTTKISVTNTTTSVTSTTTSVTSTTPSVTISTCKPICKISKTHTQTSVPSTSYVFESESESESEGTTRNSEPPSKKPKKSYNFNDKWLSNALYSTWLLKKTKNDETVAYCKVCDTNLVNHKPALDKHVRTAKHQMNTKSILSVKPIPELLTHKPEDQQIKRAEIKISAFIAEHNLPISLVDDLVPFMANIFPDSNIAKKITLGRTKATNIITKLLAPACANEIIDIIKIPGNFFSIVMDETTDNTIKKQCALTVIFYNPHIERVETKFLDMFEVDSGKAEDLSAAVLNWLEVRSIPFKNFVGFASDTTNSMVGEHNSVFSHLKEKIPNITCIKCSCHLIHLVASKSCLKLPRSVEDMLRNIAAHFSRSSKRQSKLLEFQKFFEIDCHKILSPSNTRWLSLKACVDRTLEQYDVLKEYFRIEVFEDPSKITESILETLNNKIVKVYLEFMSYTLEILNDFNKLFQSEKPLLHCLRPEIEKIIKTIGCNYLDFNYMKTTPALNIEHANPRRFLPLDQIYLGIAAQATVKELEDENSSSTTKADITNLKKNCLAFYIEIINQIKQRFQFEDPVFEAITVLNPQEAQTFKIKDLTDVTRRYSILKEFVSEQELHIEWRNHALLDFNKMNLSPSMDAEDYWKAVFNLKNVGQNSLFPNLKKALNLLLVLPFSNVSVERIFSQLKLIKTDHRNRLNTNTIAALMTIKQRIKSAIDYEPPKSLLTSIIKLH